MQKAELEKITLLGNTIDVIVVGYREYLVPLRMLCDRLKIDFEKTMFAFNKFRIEVKFETHVIDNEEYICLNNSDFITFVFVMSNHVPNLMSMRNSLTKLVSDNFINKELIYKDIESEIQELFEPASCKSDLKALTPSDVYNLLTDRTKKNSNVSITGVVLKKLGYTKKGVKIDSLNSRYCYMLKLKGAHHE